MGVPRVFQWIVKKYPKTFTKTKKDCSYLCYDVNGLLHPCVRKSIQECGKFDLNHISRLVREKMLELAAICKPSKGIYICIDGVAPVAKMLQQRYRRFKTVYDKEVEHKIYSKHGQSTPFSWDTNAITPSTEFMGHMNKLFSEISAEIGTIYPSCEIYYSDSDSPGEGEHKIMEKLRTIQYSSSDSIYIHGLDADLIFLSIGLEKDNIYLMREGEDSIGYLDISALKSNLFLEIQALSKIKLERLNVEKDFMVISYFLGNDFLPQVFSLDVYDLSHLLERYSQVVNIHKRYLVHGGKIQWDIFEKLCEKASENEYFNVKNRVKKYISMRVSDSGLDTQVARDIFWEKQCEHKDHLKLLESGWKERFYEHYFGFEQNNWNSKNDMILNYLEGLQWNLDYYLTGVKNWMWYYKYHAAPFFGDIYHYLHKRGTTQLVKNIQHNTKPTHKPSSIEQLLVVLPPQSSSLIPTKYRCLMESIESDIIDLYPISYKLEHYYKAKDWEYKPKLPDVQFSRVVHAVKTIQ
jgi:5'-3' exonuclease